MLRCINEEVQVREKCLLSKVTVGQSRKQTPVEETKGRWASRNNQATTAALYTEHGIDNERNRAIKCVFCDAAHKLHLCKKVTNHNVRRKILSQKNRCFICLRPGHVARNCRTNMRCLKCNRRHHFTSRQRACTQTRITRYCYKPRECYVILHEAVVLVFLHEVLTGGVR